MMIYILALPYISQSMVDGADGRLYQHVGVVNLQVSVNANVENGKTGGTIVNVQ